jgi:hypothetical protein
VALNPTAPVKLVRLIAIVDVAVAPRATEVALPGPTVKSLPVFTVSDTGVLRASEPDVPVMQTLAAPSVAVPDAVNVAVTLLPVVAADGLNATVTPDGSPVALNDTAPVKLVRLMATVVLAVPPRARETEAGEAATV